MFSKVEIANIAMSKIGSSRIEDLDPPRSELERHIATNYDHWRRLELTKRRWLFAIEDCYALPHLETLDTGDLRYVYLIPPEVLRPLRGKSDTWKQRGRKLFADKAGFDGTMLMDVQEADFDPMFVEVFASAIALGSVEYDTQSNTKKADTLTLYREAVKDAGRVNAYTTGPQDVTSDDSAVPFITERL